MANTVLIVEDEFLVAMDLEEIVSNAGYKVIGIAPDHAAASTLAEVPEVALVDLNLRDGLTGPEIARQLANQHGTRVVFVTANPAQIGAPPPGAVGFVQKPFSVDAVIAAISIAGNRQPDRLPRGLTLFQTN